MSSRGQRHNNNLIDWRMLPLGILSLAIGAVVSYSVGSNFGVGYIKIDQLPITAAELAISHRMQPEQVAVEVVQPITETVIKAAEPQQAPQNVMPATVQSQPETEKPSTPKVLPESSESLPTAENLPTEAVADAEKEKEAEVPAIPVDESVSTSSIKPIAKAKTSVLQSVSVDEQGNEIVKLSLDQIVVPQTPEVDLPDTADIVARANLAAGVEPREEETEENIVEDIIGELENDQAARFSTDPEDLPILRVIIPDKDTADVVVQKPESKDIPEEFTEATLSREITDAVDSGVVSRVLKLIEKGEPLDGKDRAGQTMLIKAAWNGDEEMLDALLNLGANVNLSSNDGRTPLFSATVSGNIQLVIKLVELGASVNTKTKQGKTPLMVSAWSNYPEIALYLLEQGAQPDLIDANGRNALFYALWDRNIDVVRTLIQYGARLDQVDTEGHSAVDIARLRRIELPGMDLEAESESESIN
ncbi:MAG: ankyrin repeat domain-containing protein [Acidiferrobacterales bacterium]|nr:ankyrin repeat domain-containing protein [Acidiferrobacterales bacterium]